MSTLSLPNPKSLNVGLNECAIKQVAKLMNSTRTTPLYVQACTGTGFADLIKAGRPSRPHQHRLTPRDLIKAGRPAERPGLTTGPKKTAHPLGCQDHCKRQCQPSLLSCPIQQPPPEWPAGQWDSYNVRPRRLAAGSAEEASS
ncbi:hypothetical protein WMY93_029526 [Mugilogobius chulae]|uniref:Uncharacterized protein n=1 Tax=Mugilogobius chulae TaxID=88201 RepID=A0AAW0N1N4_9GOBI